MTRPENIRLKKRLGPKTDLERKAKFATTVNLMRETGWAAKRGSVRT